MDSLSNADLIRLAKGVLKPYRTNGRLFGDVGAALQSDEGAVYTGVCVDTPGWGLCAERSAVAAMITAGHYRIRKIVAVWRDEETGKLHVLPPCGICRDFMRHVDDGNLDAEIVLGFEQSILLRELLPFHEWPAPLD